MSQPRHDIHPAVVRELGKLTRPGLANTRRLIIRCGRNLVPNPPMGTRAWIEANVWNPSGNRQGMLRLDLAQAEVCDLLDDPAFRKVVWLKPPRSGSSTLTAALHIKKAAWDGVNSIFYERGNGEAQDWSEKKLRPMLLASVSIAHLIKPDSRSGTQDSWSDITLLNGAMIQCRGVQVDGNFKAIDGELVSLDEGGDPAFKASGKGKEGNKSGQAATRSAQYAEPKLMLDQVVSTLPGFASLDIVAGRWVLSLTDGTRIDKGSAAGTEGPAGPGITHTDIVGGNLIVTYTDGSTSNAGHVLGADGTAGTPGVGIAAIEVVGGRLHITLSNGNVLDLGQIVGATGAAGRGVTSSVISAGHLVLSFTDGSTQDLGQVTGVNGAAGTNGRGIASSAITVDPEPRQVEEGDDGGRQRDQRRDADRRPDEGEREVEHSQSRAATSF